MLVDDETINPSVIDPPSQSDIIIGYVDQTFKFDRDDERNVGFTSTGFESCAAQIPSTEVHPFKLASLITNGERWSSVIKRGLRAALQYGVGQNKGQTGVNPANVLDEPHFPFGPTPPLTSLIQVGGHLQPPLTQSRKKALLVGVEHKRTKPDLKPLRRSFHKDIRDMRQFLIGGFELNSI